MNDIVTGEAVPLELRRAKLPSRSIAIMIDLVLFAIAVTVLGVLLSQVVSIDGALAAGVSLFSFILVLVIAPATIETLTRGRSVGKFFLGLRVVRDDGGPIRFRHSLVRALAGVFADFIVTFGMGAVFCSLAHPRDKRIGDVLAGTIVIRERIPSTSSTLPSVDSKAAAWATTVEMSRLPNQLVMRARTLLARTRQLSPDAAGKLAGDLRHEMETFIAPAPPEGTSSLTYIAAIMGERHHRQTNKAAGPKGKDSEELHGTNQVRQESTPSQTSPESRSVVDLGETAHRTPGMSDFEGSFSMINNKSLGTESEETHDRQTTNAAPSNRPSSGSSHTDEKQESKNSAHTSASDVETVRDKRGFTPPS